jgi:hypothetical protein
MNGGMVEEKGRREKKKKKETQFWRQRTAATRT